MVYEKPSAMVVGEQVYEEPMTNVVPVVVGVVVGIVVLWPKPVY